VATGERPTGHDGHALRPERFAALWRSLSAIGRAGDGGYLRSAWSDADLACREWFVEEALDRELGVERDRNGNLYAWWGDRAATGAVLTGGHLDSVPHGGGYEGALGVVAALLAVDLLRERGVTPARPVGIAVFADGTGARFGEPCLGVRLLTGALDPAAALRLRDRDRVGLAETLDRAGGTADGVGPDPQRLARIGGYVELAIEQGHHLSERDAPVGIGTGVWPRGRWRLECSGPGVRAATTPMAERHDPMLTLAFAVLAANKEARLRGGYATVGRVAADPGVTTAVASHATAWLDARAPGEEALAALVDAVTAKITDRAARDATRVQVTVESRTPRVTFDHRLLDSLAATLPGAPAIGTPGTHAAGEFAPRVPAAMLFVRNATGIAGGPGERASDADCAAGVTALADALAALAGG